MALSSPLQKPGPEPFEIEEAQPRQPQVASRECLGLFPLRLCCCCPPAVSVAIPQAYHTVQDATHLVLIFGIVANLMLLAETLHTLLPVPVCLASLFCAKEILTILFTLPCTIYFFKVVGQYDERLQAKQLAVKEQRALLTKELVTTIGTMDDLLSRSAESSAGLAEQGFESKRRDFVRFMERVKSKSSQMGASQNQGELLEQFRRFVCNWLKVFEECSIDPVNHPRRVLTTQEINDCKSILELCDLALLRLELIEIRFISQQREEDAKLMDKERAVAKRVSVLAIENSGGASGPSFVDGARAVGQAARQKTMDAMQKRAGNWDDWQLAWLHVNAHCRCGYQQSDYDEIDGYYPCEFQLCCLTFSLLSREHLVLIMGLFAAIAILFLGVTQSGEGGVSLPFLVESCGALLSLVVLLIRFEDIDVIQQLQREVKDLKKSSDEVEQQHKKMNEFWSNAMELNELWLYRTVPRLDVYKEIHQHIEDCNDPQQLTKYLTGTNQRLEELEANLGQLEHWREGGTISPDSKKQFQQVMNKVCRVKDATQQLDLLASSAGQMKGLANSAGEPNPNASAAKEERKRDKLKAAIPDVPAVPSIFRKKDAVTDEKAPRRDPSMVQGFLQSNEDAFKMNP